MSQNKYFSKLIITVIGISLILLFWTYRHWFMLTLLSVLIAVGLSIPVNKLRKLGVTRGVATTISATGFFIILTFLSLWIVPTFIIQSFQVAQTIPKQFPIIQELIDENFSEIEAPIGQTISNETLAADTGTETTQDSNVESDNISINTGLEKLLKDNKELVRQAISVLSKVYKGISKLGGILGQSIFAIFLALLLLATPYAYLTGSLYLVPKDKQQRLLEIWQMLYKTLTTWLSALSFSISITMFLVWLILGVIIGMPNALLVAVIAGIATFIPNIGNFIPLLPIAVFSFSSDPKMVLITIPAYLLIQLIESNIFTPLVVKAELNLPPALVLFFQIISGLVFGFLGILMAVPILAITITLVRELFSRDILGYGNDNLIVSTTDNGKFTIETKSSSIKKPRFKLFRRK